MEFPNLNAIIEKLCADGIPETIAAYAVEGFRDDDPRTLVRLVLLAELWKEVIADDGSPWITKRESLAKSGFPFLDFDAMNRVLASGANEKDLAAVVRSVQVLTLWNTVNLLDDEGWQKFESLVGDSTLGWRLVVTQAAKGIREVGLHETFHDLDPSGRRGNPGKTE